VVVGSGESSDLAFVDGAVNRRQCYLQLIEGRLFGIDLEGRTRTRFGGRVQPMGWVRPGESIGVGPFEIQYQGGGAEPADSELPPCPVTARPEDPGRLPGATLEIVGQGLDPFHCRLSRVLTLVGNAPLCKVKLLDPRISRYHCALLKTPTGIWMIDLLSREGTLHNGTPRRVSRLDDGDRIRIGLFTIRVRLDFAPGPVTSLADDSARLLSLAFQNGEPPLDGGGNGSRSLHEALAPLVPGPMLQAADVTLEGQGTDVLLRPFFEQIALMQQQMAEQFHQSVMLMAQMLGSMQRDRLKVVRGELEQIRRLTDEIQTLRDELKQVKSAPPSIPAVPPQRATLAPSSPPPGDAPPAPTREPGRDASTRERRPPTGEGFVRGSVGPQGPPAPDRQIRRDPKEAQTRIYELLARYESERQSRWSRVIGYLTGKPSSS
jgi:hypothetical protein